MYIIYIYYIYIYYIYIIYIVRNIYIYTLQMPHNMPVPMLLEISMAAASPEATSAASASAADMEQPWNPWATLLTWADTPNVLSMGVDNI